MQSDRPMTADEERDALSRRKAGDVRAADRLITSNQRLVLKLALRYRNFGVPLEDLIQEGNVGLCHALSKFDASRGFRFTTYAVHWARAYMTERLRRDVSVVRRTWRHERPLVDASLDVVFPDTELRLVDRLVDGAPGAETVRGEHEDAARVRAAMHVLDGRERDIVTRRCADEPWTLARLGIRHHVSRERVRQIERRALQKLRRRLAAGVTSYR